MKKTNLQLRMFSVLTASFFLTLGWPAKGSAQVGLRKSPVQELEYSLKSLYESASEISKKNKWLQGEIEKMDQEIIFLRGEMRSLETQETKKRISSALDDREMMSTIPWDEKRLNLMYEDYIEFDEENAYIKDRLEGKQSDQKGIEQALRSTNREVAQLSKQREALQEKLNKRVGRADIDRVENALTRSKKSLKYANRKYKRIEKRHGRPLRQFSGVRDKNIALKGRVAFLEDQLQNLRAQKSSIEEEIEHIKAVDGGKLTGLNDDISVLKDERKALLTVMEKASLKLGNKFVVPDYNQQIENVRLNIEAIREDNLKLKRELNILEKRIRK